MSSVCVYCGSSPGADPAFGAAAANLGAAIAGGGHRLVYGGGNVGLMGIVADATLAGGGEVIGVMTTQLVDFEVAHRGLTSLEVVDTMHERKARMAALADGVIVLPGGFGTWEEAVEALTWNQLGLVSTPVVFCDIAGFYEPFFAMLDTAVDAALLKPANADLAQRATDVGTALSLALTAAPNSPPKWIGQ